MSLTDRMRVCQHCRKAIVWNNSTGWLAALTPKDIVISRSDCPPSPNRLHEVNVPFAERQDRIIAERERQQNDWH